MDDIVSVAECEALVSTPGKFQGEQRYVPYLYHVAVEYGADDEEWDDDDEVTYIFKITDEDHDKFPELEVGRTVRIFTDNNGFVHEIKHD